MRIAGAQINLLVGGLDANEAQISEVMDWAETEGADVLLLPELAVTGYPPEDLVLRLGFVEDNLDVVRRLAARSGRCTTVVGFVDLINGGALESGDATNRNVANAAAILQGGEWRATYRKILLPNYGVFDEERYFVPGENPTSCGRSVVSRPGSRSAKTSGFRTALLRSRRKPGPKSC